LIQLRPYQTQAIEDIRAAMKRHKAVLFQLVTGGGKTNTAAFMIKAAMDKDNVVFFCVHRKNLLKQSSRTLKKFGIYHSHIAAGHPTNPVAKIFLASIDTLRNRLEDVPVPKIIFIDECHLSASPSWTKVIDYFKAKGAWVIGLTATPERLDGKGLDTHFTVMVKGPSMRWMIDNGFLSEYRMFCPSQPDMSGVATSNGDFVDAALAARVEGDPVIIGDSIRHYKKFAHGMRAIAYCVSIKHSKDVAAQFIAAGIPAAHVDGKTSTDELDRILRAFAAGEIWVLTNCALVTTGFDLAEQVGEDVVVQCIIDLSPTQSVVLYLQKVGRGLRPDGTVHILLDHAGNKDRHGLPDEERDWSLHGRLKKKRKGAEDPTIAVRQCPKCHHAFKPKPACPVCEYEFPIQYRTVDMIEGELVEVSPLELKRQKAATTENIARQIMGNKYELTPSQNKSLAYLQKTKGRVKGIYALASTIAEKKA
jgi:DNA repair protein RadD